MASEQDIEILARKVVNEIGSAPNPDVKRIVASAISEAIQAEREACAQVAGEARLDLRRDEGYSDLQVVWSRGYNDSAQLIYESIRARGKD